MIQNLNKLLLKFSSLSWNSPSKASISLLSSLFGTFISLLNPRQHSMYLFNHLARAATP